MRGGFRLPGCNKSTLFPELCDSYLERAKLNLTTVGEILGNPRAVKRCVHVTPEHLKGAIRKLDQAPDCHMYATNHEKSVVERTA